MLEHSYEPAALRSKEQRDMSGRINSQNRGPAGILWGPLDASVSVDQRISRTQMSGQQACCHLTSWSCISWNLGQWCSAWGRRKLHTAPESSWRSEWRWGGSWSGQALRHEGGSPGAWIFYCLKSMEMISPCRRSIETRGAWEVFVSE